jgi:hypothetical protein
MFTFCKYNCHSFALCLPYVNLTSYSTRHMQISNDAKLNMADGEHKDFRGPNPRHPWGIRRTWVWPSPTWRCPTSTTSPACQPGATTGHIEWLDEEASWSGTEHQQPWHQERDSSYSDFLATHPPVFADATDPLEADSWLLTTESKFGLLHYIEYQKTPYAA